MGLIYLVPLGKPCGINLLHFESTGGTEETVQLYSALEQCLQDAIDDVQNFQRNLSIGGAEVDGSILYHKAEYYKRRNHHVFYGVNTPIGGFDTDQERFLGQFGSWETPAAVERDVSFGGIVSGWYLTASHHIDLALQPGKSRELIFVLGYAELSPEEEWEAPDMIQKASTRRLIEQFVCPEQARAVLWELAEHWDTLLSLFSPEGEND